MPMRQLQKVFAGRRGGLFPQHLERRDRFLEDLVAARLAALGPFAWGVSVLRLDETAIGQGRVRVAAAKALFRSGAVVVHDEADAPLERSLPVLREGAPPLDVSLALPDAEEGEPNVSSDGRLFTRFRQSAPIAGLQATLRPRPVIHFDGDPVSPADRIPIGRVHIRDGVNELDRTVAPAAMRVLPDSLLARLAADVSSALVNRQGELLARRRQRAHAISSFSAEETPALMVLASINQALAALQDEDSILSLRPYELYLVLAELLGGLEAIEGRRAGPIPPYDHALQGAAFTALASRLLSILPAAARDKHVALRFSKMNPWTFQLTVGDPRLLRAPLYLVLSGADGRGLEQDIPRLAKVASEALLTSILHSAVRGVPLAPDFNPPASLPSNPESACFRFDTRSEYWTDILQRGNLCIHVANHLPEHVQATLYVMHDARSAP
jgi:type VI secretion system protein ImpJ